MGRVYLRAGVSRRACSCPRVSRANCFRQSSVHLPATVLFLLSSISGTQRRASSVVATGELSSPLVFLSEASLPVAAFRVDWFVVVIITMSLPVFSLCLSGVIAPCFALDLLAVIPSFDTHAPQLCVGGERGCSCIERETVYRVTCHHRHPGLKSTGIGYTGKGTEGKERARC